MNSIVISGRGVYILAVRRRASLPLSSVICPPLFCADTVVRRIACFALPRRLNRSGPVPPSEGCPASLAGRIAAGHAHAFREFFNREAAGLIRYATGILGSREDARDAAQDTFFRLWENRARLDPNTDPAALLYTILRNLARDRLRHRAVEQRPHPYLEMSHVVQAGPSADDEGGEPDDLQTAIYGALETLSPRQKEIVLLRWRRQLTYEQIGAELGIAPGTASAHMQRAIAHLRMVLPRPRNR